jgi:hypothetical protein
MQVKRKQKRWSEMNTAELAEATQEFDDPNFLPCARKPSARRLAELQRVQQKSLAARKAIRKAGQNESA